MIELKNVCKNYGVTKALIDVSCSISQGEIIGFVGPNGAGKSTTMKIITTYTAPTSGSVKVGDYDVMENPLEVRKLIGYLPESVPLYEDMIVNEYLEFIGTARHLNGNFKQRRDWVIDACGLQSVINRKIGVLSKGYKQRTCLAQALIHDPEVLILDEPTSGLDPLQIVGIRNLIRDLAHEKTIILSTHILPEVATVSDRILMVNEGRLVADGTFEELRQMVMERSGIYLEVACSKKDLQSALAKISEVEDVTFADTTKRGLVACHVYFSHEADIAGALNTVIREQGWDVLEFRHEKLSLEDSFIKLSQIQNSEGEQSAETEADEEGGAA